jgi:hypothetical protein
VHTSQHHEACQAPIAPLTLGFLIHVPNHQGEYHGILSQQRS